MQGLVIEDKKFINSRLKDMLKVLNIALETPLKKNMKDTRDPEFILISSNNLDFVLCFNLKTNLLES